MKQPNPISIAITSGVVLAVLVLAVTPGSGFNELSLVRWLHILAGIMWVGLLFYVFVAQIPGLAEAAADKGGPGGAGITKYVAPRVLLWFRWAAVATWVTGVWYLERSGNLAGAFTLGLAGESVNYYQLVIGIGAWLGSIMLFNVWVLIWPNQKKTLGIVPATDEQKVTARKTTLWATRTNFVLSIPLVLCMSSATHGLPF